MYAWEKSIPYKQSIQISLLANKPLIRQLSYEPYEIRCTY